MRSLTLDTFLAESTASPDLVARLVEVGAIVPLPDGRYDARDELVASMANALLDSGIALDDLAWSLDSRRFGLRSLGLLFSEPMSRTTEPYRTIVADLGDFEPIGRVELKGFPMPVALWRQPPAAG